MSFFSPILVTSNILVGKSCVVKENKIQWFPIAKSASPEIRNFREFGYTMHNLSSQHLPEVFEKVILLFVPRKYIFSI